MLVLCSLQVVDQTSFCFEKQKDPERSTQKTEKKWAEKMGWLDYSIQSFYSNKITWGKKCRNKNNRPVGQRSLYCSKKKNVRRRRIREWDWRHQADHERVAEPRT